MEPRTNANRESLGWKVCGHILPPNVFQISEIYLKHRICGTHIHWVPSEREEATFLLLPRATSCTYLEWTVAFLVLIIPLIIREILTPDLEVPTIEYSPASLQLQRGPFLVLALTCFAAEYKKLRLQRPCKRRRGLATSPSNRVWNVVEGNRRYNPSTPLLISNTPKLHAHFLEV